MIDLLVSVFNLLIAASKFYETPCDLHLCCVFVALLRVLLAVYRVAESGNVSEG